MLTPKERASRFIAWQRVREAEKVCWDPDGEVKKWKEMPLYSISEVDDILEELDR